MSNTTTEAVTPPMTKVDPMLLSSTVGTGVVVNSIVEIGVPMDHLYGESIERTATTLYKL